MLQIKCLSKYPYFKEPLLPSKFLGYAPDKLEHFGSFIYLHQEYKRPLSFALK